MTRAPHHLIRTKRGRVTPAIESLSAVTGLTHAFTVAIRNTEDFRDSGAWSFDPWQLG